jgi:hypothetical protein
LSRQDEAINERRRRIIRAQTANRASLLSGNLKRTAAAGSAGPAGASGRPGASGRTRRVAGAGGGLFSGGAARGGGQIT